MKIIYGLIALLVIAAVFSFFNKKTQAPGSEVAVVPDVEKTQSKENIVDGSYEIQTEQSSVSWAGKKPLIEGYINNGSLGVSGGNITVVAGAVTGVIKIDMNTLSVSNTPTKLGKESMLEEHLKSDNWFDVANNPEATFTIKSSEAVGGVNTDTAYNVTGDLTMKDQTHELTFLANIYIDANGNARATANFEFNRTLWGITAGSGSFFDNLADNAIDDMVAMSFDITATRE